MSPDTYCSLPLETPTLSPAAIGGIVGGVVLVFLVSFLLLMWKWSRNRSPAAEQEESAEHEYADGASFRRSLPPVTMRDLQAKFSVEEGGDGYVDLSGVSYG